MGGKYEGCRESQRMPEPAESEGNEATRGARMQAVQQLTSADLQGGMPRPGA